MCLKDASKSENRILASAPQIDRGPLMAPLRVIEMLGRLPGTKANGWLAVTVTAVSEFVTLTEQPL